MSNIHLCFFDMSNLRLYFCNLSDIRLDCFFICPIYVFNFVICPIYVLIVFVICLVGWSIYILFQPRGAVGKVGQNYLIPSGSLGSDFFRFLKKLVIYRPKKISSKYANKSIKRSVLKHWIQRSRFQVDLLII